MDTKFICFSVIAVAVLSIPILSPAGAASVGVCFGRNGDDLPPPADVVALYKRINVSSIRIYEPFADILDALRGSGLDVAFGPRNEELASLAQNPAAAANFVNTWILPYNKDVSIKWITLGNEVFPGEIAPFVPNAIRNVNAALQNAGVSGISVTTVISGLALTDTYPPSASRFAPDIVELMTDISSILSATNSPLMVNTYPYFAYASDPVHVSAAFALFGSRTPVVIDGEFQYFNLFEAMVDGFYAALEKINYGNVRVVVAESGWPTRGNPPYTSIENAQAFNKGLLNYVKSSMTPRRPNTPVDTFFFELITENQKPGEVEQSFGQFTPDMKPIYDLWD